MTVNEQEIPNKSIPANLEAERAVLGALLIDPDAIIKVASYLRPEDFYRERHAWLYEALFSLNERREPLDFVTLMDELERRGQLEEIGGPAYISDLVNSTPTAMYVDHYARIVERTAVLRRLISAAGRIAELAYDESQEVDVVMDRAEQIIFGVSESRIHRDLTPLRMIMGNVVDRIDELARNPDRLMGVPTGFTMLDRMLGGLQKSDLIILAGRPGMGKCVTANTQLVDPTTGALHTIAELVQQQRANVLTLNEQFKLQPTTASAFLDDGIKPAFRVQTASGREVEVTLTHPFLTILGWRPLGELAAGELIAVPRLIPVFGQDDAPEHQVKTLAYLLADGCMTGVNPQFTNENARLRADFSEAALQFSGTKVQVETSGGTRTPTIRVAGDLDYVRAGRKHFGSVLHTRLQETNIPVPRLAEVLAVSPSLVYQWVAGRCVPSAETFVEAGKFLTLDLAQLAPNGVAAISKNSPNEMTRWLKTQGVWGKSAAEKMIPSSVFRYTRSKLALFLNRLFACDGSLYLQNASQPAISYSTISKRLAHDVQHLLLRFGILSKLRHRQIKYNGDIRIAYELRITNSASIQCFCSEIGAIGKEEAVATLLARLQERPENTNLDVIPQSVWEKILAAKGEQSWRSVFKKLGMAEDSNLHVGQRAPSRKRLLQLADALDSLELSTLAQSDLYWDEITSIEYIGDQQVYDLTIPTTHNFVANDILVHNTSFALSIAQNAAERYDSRVAVFSLEMSNEQMAQRLLSMQTSIDSHRLRMGAVHEDEWDELMKGANALANSKIFIDDTPAVSVTEVRTKSRRLYAEQGLDLILIDYMQLMSGEGGGGGREGNRQQEISYISRSLKSLARELNVPIIALSQLSRAVEARSDKRPMLSDLRESGCLAGDTLVYLPETGKYIPIQELEGQKDFMVLSLNLQTLRLEQTPVSQAFCTGEKLVYKLETQLGRTIRATANHKFLTIHGWKHLDELQEGEHIALPRNLPSPIQVTMTNAELALLGHLIGDGCVLPRHVVQYTTRELDLAQLVVQFATDVFGVSVDPQISPERQWYQVYLTSAQRLTHGKRNPISQWFSELGIAGLRSYEKYVPAKVFEQSIDGVAIFLRHLWATDGCIRMTWGKSPRPAIYYASSSRRLAQDVQSLLLRFGINSRLRISPQHTRGRDQHHVIVSGQVDVLQFAEKIGAVGQYKQNSLQEILHWVQPKSANTNRDIIPNEVWRMYAVPAMQAQKITTRTMQAELEMEYCGTSLYKSNLSRARTARVAAVVNSIALQQLADSDVYWDTIHAIKPDGSERVYDLTVPGNHNFVAENILVHNSIEQDADVVLFIYREDYYVEDTDRQNIADVLIAKHRHGSTGTVSLYFRKELTQFRDLEIQRTELEY